VRVKFSAVGERYRVHHEIEAAPARRDLIEDGVDGRRVGDVAMASDDSTDFLGQGLDPLLQRIALIGKRQLGALRPAGLGDPPGDRAVVGDPHHQATFAAHETGRFHHFPRPAPMERLPMAMA
jgi:hypothetical protein